MGNGDRRNDRELFNEGCLCGARIQMLHWIDETVAPRLIPYALPRFDGSSSADARAGQCPAAPASIPVVAHLFIICETIISLWYNEDHKGE